MAVRGRYCGSIGDRVDGGAASSTAVLLLDAVWPTCSRPSLPCTTVQSGRSPELCAARGEPNRGWWTVHERRTPVGGEVSRHPERGRAAQDRPHPAVPPECGHRSRDVEPGATARYAGVNGSDRDARGHPGSRRSVALFGVRRVGVRRINRDDVRRHARECSSGTRGDCWHRRGVGDRRDRGDRRRLGDRRRGGDRRRPREARRSAARR